MRGSSEPTPAASLASLGERTIRPLPLKLPLGEGETPSDYLSRLSYRNGRDSLRKLCKDFGIDGRAVAAGEEASLAQVAWLSSCDPEALRADAVTRVAEHRYTFRGETLTSACAPFDHVWVCPACLAEDLDRWDYRREARPFRRASWCLACVRTCPDHNLSLVHLGHGEGPERKHTSRFLAAAVGDLDAVASKTIERAPTPFESYILSRLRGGRGQPWLDALPLFAAMQTCSALGVVELRGPDAWPKDLSPDDRRECDAAGYEVASKGVEGVNGLVESLHRSFVTPGREQGASRVLGSLFQWLSYRNLDSAYDGVKDAVRAKWLELVPMKTGDRFLGRAIERRRIHSIRSAAAAYGIRRTMLRRVLRIQGVIGPETDTLPDTKVTFDAMVADGILKEAASALNLEQAGTRLGMPQGVTESAIEGGLLVPWIRATPGVIKQHFFRNRDIEEFQERLRSVGRTEGPADASLLPLTEAARRVGVDQIVIARLALEGRLGRVALRKGEPAYRSVLVDPDEIASTLTSPTPLGHTSAEAAKLMGVSKPVVAALIRIGALRGVVSRHPLRNRRRTLLTDVELDWFRLEFVGLKEIADAVGTSGMTARAMLMAKGIEPAFPAERIRKHYYRREDVTQAGFGPCCGR